MKLTWSFLSKYFPFAFSQNILEVLFKLTIPKEKLNREKNPQNFNLLEVLLFSFNQKLITLQHV